MCVCGIVQCLSLAQLWTSQRSVPTAPSTGVRGLAQWRVTRQVQCPLRSTGHSDGPLHSLDLSFPKSWGEGSCAAFQLKKIPLSARCSDFVEFHPNESHWMWGGVTRLRSYHFLCTHQHLMLLPEAAAPQERWESRPHLEAPFFCLQVWPSLPKETHQHLTLWAPQSLLNEIQALKKN